MNVYRIFLPIVIQIPITIHSMGTCVPNSQFIMNGFLCACAREGVRSRVSCSLVGGGGCAAGERLRRGCSRCTCRGGDYLCDHTLCPDHSASLPDSGQLSAFGRSCTPFRSYYFNCSLCVCPSSGKSSDARCIRDLSCPLINEDLSHSSVQNICMPDVIYLFPCLHCVCSEAGTFVYENCVEKCLKPRPKSRRRCAPGSMYRVSCSVCRCPENGVRDDTLCEGIECNRKTTRPVIRSVEVQSMSCRPHSFTEPKCYYCDCTPDGAVNDRSCIEVGCSKIMQPRNNDSSNCIAGEVVPLCIECFCLQDKRIRSEYCTRNCMLESKLEILEKVLNDSFNLIDDNRIAKIDGNDKCEPNFLYLNDENRYCLCPTGLASAKACTSYYRHTDEAQKNLNIEIDYNADCKPSTLVEFGCNVCFCSKSGKIDAKWCTADDCEAIRQTQESHRSYPVKMPAVDLKPTCNPGSISKTQCNFCICPDSGLSKDRVCTKNDCGEVQAVPHHDLVCEPLSYYKVDCNVCLCPKDGLKNVAKCTKNVCETNFLRMDLTCTPGHLFVEDCNICVCPVNGKKEDMACTNHLCEKKSWRVLKSMNVPMSQMNVKRNLDVCFLGEEYVQGCNLCVCPEEGLKAYGICEDIACDQTSSHDNLTTSVIMESSKPTALATLEGEVL